MGFHRHRQERDLRDTEGHSRSNRTYRRFNDAECNIREVSLPKTTISSKASNYTDNDRFVLQTLREIFKFSDKPLDVKLTRFTAFMDSHKGLLNSACVNVALAGLAAVMYADPNRADECRQAVKKLLPHLHNPLQTRNIWENTSVFQSLTTLGIVQEGILTPIINQISREYNQYSQAEIIQCLRGFTNLNRAQNCKYDFLIAKLCNLSASNVDQLKTEQAATLVIAMSHLLIRDSRIFNFVCEKIIAKESDSSISIEKIGLLATSLALLNFRHDKFISFMHSFVHDNITSTKTDSLITTTHFIWSCDVLGQPIDSTVIRNFSLHLNNTYKNLPIHAQLRIARDMVPVRIMHNLDYLPCPFPSLEELYTSFSEQSTESYFQRQLDKILNDHGIKVQTSCVRVLYELDLLVTNKHGKQFNIEADGHMFHLLTSVDEELDQPYYRGIDRYRDLVLKKLNIPVIRILTSECDQIPREQLQIWLLDKIQQHL